MQRSLTIPPHLKRVAARRPIFDEVMCRAFGVHFLAHPILVSSNQNASENSLAADIPPKNSCLHFESPETIDNCSILLYTVTLSTN